MARCVLTNVPGGYPLSNVDIELVRTDTMAIVQVVQTNKAGEAQFTTTLPAPCFFRPRIIGKNWNLQVTDTGLGYSLYDRVVATDGLGTDLNFTTAIAALAATGGTIGARTGDYHEGAILTIPTTKNYVIEGIGHGILEDVNFTPVMGVQIHNPGGAGGFNGVIFHVDTGARLTLRGVEVHQDRAYAAIEAHTNPWIIVEDSWVHSDSTGAGIDSSYQVRIHRSVIECGAGESIDVGTAIVYLEVTESRLTSTTYAVNGSFAEAYFEKCQMSKFRCHTTTIASKLRIENCKVAGGTAGSPGIEVGNGGHDDIQIFDNEIDGGTGHAIQIGYTTLDLAERYQVNNNRMKSTAGHGLYIAGYVKGLTACGNMFSGNAAGYCIETANALYPEYAVFGCNTHDGSALGVYGPTLSSTTYGAHALLDGVMNSDTLAGAVLDGDIIIGNVTPKWSRLAISIPAANVRNVFSIDNGELRPSWKGALNDTHPADIAAVAAEGTSLIFAHLDHVHAHPNLGDLHTVYLLASGARALTGNWFPGAFVIGNYDFTARPTHLDIGDLNFELYLEAGGPVIIFDAALDFLGYVRASNYFTFVIGGTEYLRISAAGLLVDNINELVLNAGVTIETVLIKDGLVDGIDVSVIGAASHAAVTLSVAAEVLLGLATQEIGLDTQAANLIFAGPTTGAVAAPTFRSLVLADIPAEIATWEGVIDMIGAVTSFFFTPVVSDLGGIYYNMTVAPSPAVATNFSTGAIGSDTNTLIYTSVSSVVETPANIVAGLLDLHIHALRVSGGRNLRVYSTFHVRSAGGVDGAAFATTELSNLLTDASAEYDIHAIQAADQAFAVNERLVVNTFINSNGGTPNATVGRITIAGTTAAHISVGIDAAAFDHVYLTPAAHTAIGDGAPHHAAITLAASAAVLMDLTGQAISLDTQAANTFLAGRADVGAAQAPTFRTIVALDLGTGAPSGLKFLRDDLTWQVPAGGGGGDDVLSLAYAAAL